MWMMDDDTLVNDESRRRPFSRKEKRYRTRLLIALFFAVVLWVVYGWTGEAIENAELAQALELLDLIVGLFIGASLASVASVWFAFKFWQARRATLPLDDGETPAAG